MDWPSLWCTNRHGEWGSCQDGVPGWGGCQGVIWQHWRKGVSAAGKLCRPEEFGSKVCRNCVQYRHIMTFTRTHIYTHTHMCICILYIYICMIYMYIHVYITYTYRLYILCMHIQTSDVLTWIPWAFRISDGQQVPARSERSLEQVQRHPSWSTESIPRDCRGRVDVSDSESGFLCKN